LVQVCYECGAERPAREINDDFATERFNLSRAAAKAEVVKLSTQRVIEDFPTQAASQERIAVGQGRARKFSLVK
jgi:hypothetical protein